MDTKTQTLSFFMLFGGILIMFLGFASAYHFENKRVLSLLCLGIGFIGEAMMIIAANIIQP